MLVVPNTSHRLCYNEAMGQLKNISPQTGRLVGDETAEGENERRNSEPIRRPSRPTINDLVDARVAEGRRLKRDGAFGMKIYGTISFVGFLVWVDSLVGSYWWIPSSRS